MDVEEQVQAYTAWINSQLKKRSQKIVNLGEDLRDGTALISVVEIVSGQNLGGIAPTNTIEKRENISKVLKFMKNSGIKLHHVTIDEIVNGNVKTMMQLILALAAHFKPASIGGRKVESPRQQADAAARIKQRWRDSRAKEITRSFEIESSVQADVEKELATIRDITEALQKVLLEELPGQPLEGQNAEEENVIIQARLDQSFAENIKLEEEIQTARQENRKILSEKSALQQRFHQQEDELATLRQQILHSNLTRDKLQSEKAELVAELSETQQNRDHLKTKCREQERALERMENEAIQNKINHSRELRKKEKELLLARQDAQQYNGPSPNDSVFYDKSIISSSPIGKPLASPILGRSPAPTPKVMSPISPTPRSPILSRAGDKLARRSPLSRNHPSRRRKTMDNQMTRVLYFTDRDMTPCMTSIPKRVGDITLGEFKAVIRKEGNFRFIFKALDPELGTVKEEVFHNDDVIPGWEGKIVAWVEEVLRV